MTKGYPITLNGDHAEFEREHANTPPHERPDWPLSSFAARDWAAAFIAKNPNCGVSEDVMLGWFANALMRGFDEHAAMAARTASLAIREAVKAEREACAKIADEKASRWDSQPDDDCASIACGDVAAAIRERPL